MLALFRPLCWCFMPWLYSWLYTEALYHGFILGFILGFMSLGRGVSVASVASGAVLATAGAHRGATPQLGNSAFLTTLFCFIFVFIPVLYAGKSWALFRRSCWVVRKLQQLLILAYSVLIRVLGKNNSCLFCFILLYSGFF